MRYVYETAVLVGTSFAILHGILHVVAGATVPVNGYTDKDRASLNWLVQQSTREINGKLQGRVTE